MEVKDERDVTLIAGKLIEAIQSPCHQVAGDQGITLCIPASLGISLLPKHGTTAEALINQAESARCEAEKNRPGYFFPR